MTSTRQATTGGVRLVCPVHMRLVCPVVHAGAFYVEHNHSCIILTCDFVFGGQSKILARGKMSARGKILTHTR